MGYEVARDGVVVGTATLKTFTDAGLDPATAHAYAVIAFDDAGNKSPTSAPLSAGTAADATAPGFPAAPVVAASTGTSVTLSWLPATDNAGVVAYDVYYANTLAGSTAGTTFAVTGLTPGQTNRFHVTARDAAGNGGNSGDLWVTPTDSTVEAPADSAPDQYVPDAYRTYFYNDLTAALRERSVEVGQYAPPAAGWLDTLPDRPGMQIPGGDWYRDTVVAGGHVVAAGTALPLAPVLYVDADLNGGYDAGETAWLDASGASAGVYDAGDTLLVGTAPAAGTFGSGRVRYVDVNGNGVFDAGEALLTNLDLVHGTGGRLAYRDLNGTGSWGENDPIWDDADGDSKYDAGETVVYAGTPSLQAGDWGKKAGLYYADVPTGGGATTRLVWADGDAYRGAEGEFRQDFGRFYPALETLANCFADPDLSGRPMSVDRLLGQLGRTQPAHSGTVTAGPRPADGFYVTGTGTHFTTELHVGDCIQLGDEDAWYTVRNIVSDTSLYARRSSGRQWNATIANAPYAVLNWTAVPARAATAAGEPALAYQAGRPDGNGLIFAEQFQELRGVLQLLNTAPSLINAQPAAQVPVAAPPTDPIPLTTAMDYRNAVPDTDLDGVVAVAHDQDSLGDDTGSIAFQANRDMAQSYLPVGTDTTGPLAVHGYLVQGSFGTAAAGVGDLRSAARWAYPDADEAGQTFAYSLDTRVRTNLLLSHAANHVKRVEVVRPGGNAVVFDFAWDAAANQFAPVGAPAGWNGRDGRRLYALRDLTPHDDADSEFELRFPSGITHVFGGANGRLFQVRDADGLASSVLYNLFADVDRQPVGTYDTPTFARYRVGLDWSDGRLAGVDYTTRAAAGQTPQTIHTAVGYAAGSAAVASLAKSDAAGPIDEFSYALTGPGAVVHRGVEVDRSGSATTGSRIVTLTVKNAPGQSNFAGQTTEAVTFNADGLATADTFTLNDGAATTSATTTYQYGTGAARYANGGAPWGKVTQVTGPDGSWVRYEYDPATGWAAKTVTPFKNSAAADGNDAHHVVTAYGYADPAGLAAGTSEAADATRLVERPRTVVTTVSGVQTDAAMSKYNGLTTTTRHAPTSAAPTWGQGVLQSTLTVWGGFGYGYALSTPTGNLSTTATVSGGTTTATTTGSYFGQSDSTGTSQSTSNPFGTSVFASTKGPGLTPTTSDARGAGQTDAFGRPKSSTSTGLPAGTAFDQYTWRGPGKVTAPDQSVTTYTYTPLGQVRTATAYGVAVTYDYDAAGHVVRATTEARDAGGSPVLDGDGLPLETETSATYDAQGRVTSSTDELGHATGYAYASTAAGTTVTTTYVDHTTKVEQYRLDGSLASVSGTAVTPSAYDFGVLSAADAYGRAGEAWSQTSANNGQEWVRTYADALGRAYKTVRSAPGGAVAASTTEYDANGRVAKVTGFDGTVSLYAYDPRTGAPAVVVDRDGDGTYTPYTDSKSVSRPTAPTTSETTPAGSTGRDFGDAGVTTDTSTTSNGGTDATETVNGLTTTTHVAFPAGGGEVVTTTAADGTKVVETWKDGLLDKREQIGANGTTVLNTTTFGYDALRRNNSVTDWTGTTAFDLRPDGSVSAVHSPDGRTQSYGDFDAKTNAPKAVNRADGQTATQTLGDRGERTTASGAGTLPQRFHSDALTGQLTGLDTFTSGLLDGAGKATTGWAYDAGTGLLTAKTYNDSSQDTYTYNGKFQLTGVTKPGLTGSSFAYNFARELTGSTLTDAAAGSLTDTVLRRDDKGRVVLSSEASGGRTATQAFGYDSLDRLALDQGGPSGAGVKYEYYPTTGTYGAGDAGSPGAVKSVKVVRGTAVLSETTYAYDEAGKRLHTLTVKGQGGAADQVFTYAYQAGTDLVASVTRTGTGLATAGTAYAYDPQNGRLTTVGTTAGTAAVASSAYGYYATDQRQTDAFTRAQPDGSTQAGTATYTYGAADQLTGVSTAGTGGPGAGAWAYDGVGNRSGFAGGVKGNGLNQYADYAYDGRGNLTDDGVSTYAYDAADRLTAVTPKAPTLTSQKVTFQYDPQGRRAEKDTLSWDGSQWVAAGVRRYAFDGRRVAAEFDGANVLQVGYTWGPTGLLAVTDYTGSQPATYTAVPDGSGNVVALVDGSGAVAAAFRYDAWGVLLAADGPAAGLCPVGWGGGYRDAETGLVLLDARYYSPAQGRFLTRDPAAEAGGVNLYAYCGNDPVNRWDPSGRSPYDLPWTSREEVAAEQQKLKDWWEGRYAKPTQNWNADRDEYWIYYQNRKAALDAAATATGAPTYRATPGYTQRSADREAAAAAALEASGYDAKTGAMAGVEAGLVNISDKGATILDVVAGETEWSRGVHQARAEAWIGMQGTYTESASDALAWTGIACIAAAGALQGGAAIGLTELGTVPLSMVGSQAAVEGAALLATGSPFAHHALINYQSEATVIEETAPAALGNPARTPLFNCFPRSTPVAVENGLRPISQVIPGDRVWAYDFKEGAWRLCEVLARHDSVFDGLMVGIETAGGSVEATADHPFWVEAGVNLEVRPALKSIPLAEDRDGVLAGRWVASQNVCQGDTIFLRGQGATTVRRVTQWHSRLPVCNLTVQGLHTFCVGDPQILVHNTSETPGTALKEEIAAHRQALLDIQVEAIRDGEPVPGIHEPGPYAGEGIAVTKGQSVRGLTAANNVNGSLNGCHICGASAPGSTHGNWIKDHIPASHLVRDGDSQMIFPSCQSCSDNQGWLVRNLRALREWLQVFETP